MKYERIKNAYVKQSIKKLSFEIQYLKFNIPVVRST